VQSIFRAAANITFPGDFVLALNALDAPRVPNGLQLSASAGTFPFSELQVGMPVLFGAQRLHIEALPLSLDLTYCERWNPSIARPEQLNLAIIEKNGAWLARYLAQIPEQTLPRYPPPGYPRGVPLPWTNAMGQVPSMVGVPLAGTLDGGTGMGTEAGLLPPFPSVQVMAQTLCGRGPGLTPSGDDMLAGWMAANWLLHGPHPCLLAACQQILAIAEHQTHLLSRCWLRYAAQGYVAEPIGRLLTALTHEHNEELIKATQAVLALGATSGRDILQGILLGLEGMPGW
jgi:hypothetical protein